MAKTDKPRLIYRTRLIALLAVMAVAGAPALALRVLCVGHSCDAETDASSEVPYCSLPEKIRRPLASGFRMGRSPEVLVVTRDTITARAPSHEGGVASPLPSLRGAEAARVPIAFYGPGIAPGEIPAGTGLDDIAETVAQTIDLRRKFPEVRSGEAVPGLRTPSPPALLVVVALKGVGSEDVEARVWPVAERIVRDGASTMAGATESLPLDPAPALATIGTGGLPRQHGIIGSVLRNDDGDLVRAWGRNAPVSVISALGDDLDELLDQEPLVALAGSEVTDRGLIGGDWYVDTDKDVISVTDDPGREAVKLLARDFGRDDVPDLLGVALSGKPKKIDDDLGAIIAAADEASSGNYVLALAGTGSTRSRGEDGMTARGLTAQVEEDVSGRLQVIEAVSPAGLFLDQGALAEAELSEDAVIRALKRVTRGGRRVLVDAFPAVAVSFSKYC